MTHIILSIIGAAVIIGILAADQRQTDPDIGAVTTRMSWQTKATFVIVGLAFLAWLWL